MKEFLRSISNLSFKQVNLILQFCALHLIYVDIWKGVKIAWHCKIEKIIIVKGGSHVA